MIINMNEMALSRCPTRGSVRSRLVEPRLTHHLTSADPAKTIENRVAKYFCSDSRTPAPLKSPAAPAGAPTASSRSAVPPRRKLWQARLRRATPQSIAVRRSCLGLGWELTGCRRITTVFKNAIGSKPAGEVSHQRENALLPGTPTAPFTRKILVNRNQ